MIIVKIEDGVFYWKNKWFLTDISKEECNGIWNIVNKEDLTFDEKCYKFKKIIRDSYHTCHELKPDVLLSIKGD